MKKVIASVVALVAAGTVFAAGKSAVSNAGGNGGKKNIPIISVFIPASIPAPVPTPTPAPAPAPMATPLGLSIPSPSLAGLATVSLPSALTDYLQPAWGTGAIPAHDDDVGAFRFLCAPSHNAYNDPIVYPGQPGKSHLHTFFGNTLADANSTYASLRTTGDSTATIAQPLGLLDSGDDERVGQGRHARLSVGLLQADAVERPALPDRGDGVRRCRAGCATSSATTCSNPASTPTDIAKRWWNCDGAGATSGHFATIKEALAGCPAGSRLGVVLVAPDCWNGKDLDSPDHRSHMAYRVL